MTTTKKISDLPPGISPWVEEIKSEFQLVAQLEETVNRIIREKTAQLQKQHDAAVKKWNEFQCAHADLERRALEATYQLEVAKENYERERAARVSAENAFRVLDDKYTEEHRMRVGAEELLKNTASQNVDLIARNTMLSHLASKLSAKLAEQNPVGPKVWPDNMGYTSGVTVLAIGGSRDGQGVILPAKDFKENRYFKFPVSSAGLFEWETLEEIKSATTVDTYRKEQINAYDREFFILVYNQLTLADAVQRLFNHYHPLKT
jgi:hypothetical protein